MSESKGLVGVYEVRLGKTGWTVYAKTPEALEEVKKMGWGGKIGGSHLYNTKEEAEKIKKAINSGKKF
ncbi:hypothetical protein COY23_00010 [bacterium (Candidatus Torokbacteria) CG_4_10_14_0_2_um_filter_35_8]|nr:MAG: hypothetical protein COY23_00010 [bacterium (Candidatus Torokbacteria) CG_4_10_14_0_2_um_filter_35_8]